MKTYPRRKYQAVWFLRRVEKRLWQRYLELARPGSQQSREEQQAARDELHAHFKVSILEYTVRNAR